MTLVTVTLVRVILPAFEIVPEIIIVPPGGTGFAGQFFVTTTRSEEHTSELQSHSDLVCRLLLEKKKNMMIILVIVSEVDSVHLDNFILGHLDVLSGADYELSDRTLLARGVTWLCNVMHCVTYV